MSLRCDDLDPFFDGELPEADASAFRRHLATCERCQRALRGRMLEAAVVSAPDDLAARRARKRTPRWIWPVGVGVAAAAAAAVAVVIIKPGHPDAPGNGALVAAAASSEVSLAGKRNVDVRFCSSSLDRYRPRNVQRAASEDQESIAQQVLANLEQQRDYHGLVGALALAGSLPQANKELSRLPLDAAGLSDRAALALLEPDDGNSQANAERALSLAVQARRLDPKHAQAMWNEAVALERLHLPIEAGRAFEAIAARNDPGWSDEARDRAKALKRGYDEQVAAWRQHRTAAQAMARGGAVMSVELAAFDPSATREAVHIAVAATADPARLAALAALAGAPELADAFGAEVVPELAKIRASNLAQRAPIAKRLAAAVAAAPDKGWADPAILRTLRASARAARLDDIARAISLLIPDHLFYDQDVGELDAVAAAGPWWREHAERRRGYYLTYRTHHFADAVAAGREAAEACHDRYWCPPLLAALAHSTSQMGRVDRAYELAGKARRLAREAGDLGEEGRVLNVLGQIAALRVADGIDPSAVTDAYLRESAARTLFCATKLYRLDHSAHVALGLHRYADAARLLREADQLDETECKDEGVRFNAEAVRLGLIVHGDQGLAPALERRVQRVKDEYKFLEPELRLYTEYLLARSQLALAGDTLAAAALRAVVDKAAAFSGQYFAREMRLGGLSGLAEHAARRGTADEALAAIAERLGVQLEPGCAVGINDDDRVTVVVRGSTGPAVAQIREVPEGQRALPAHDLLTADLRAQLAACPRIDVLATGTYLGIPGLLDGDLRWTYRASRRRVEAPMRLEKQVVVTDVEPPAEHRLAKLRSMELGAQRPLRGAAATPDGVLRAITDAELVVINAHGITDANEPMAASLALSPDAKGSYLLTAERVKQAKLAGAPVVILAACNAGRVQVSSEPWSLATSFLAAGARAVIAPTTEIPDDSANEVFRSIVQRMRSGKSPEQAVTDERAARGDLPWLASVVVFQ